MAVGSKQASVVPLSPSVAWGLALLTFGVLDVAVTVYALFGLAAEGHPAYLAVLNMFSFFRPLGFVVQLVVALTVWKAGTFLVLYLLYRISPRDWRIGVPLALAGFGTAVLVWNLYAIGLFHRLGLF